jgi:hypothetical protein
VDKEKKRKTQGGEFNPLERFLSLLYFYSNKLIWRLEA